MTKINIDSGVDVYTELSVSEVRTYLQRGVGTKTIPGFLELAKTTPILINVCRINFVYA